MPEGNYKKDQRVGFFDPPIIELADTIRIIANRACGGQNTCELASLTPTTFQSLIAAHVACYITIATCSCCARKTPVKIPFLMGLVQRRVWFYTSVCFLLSNGESRKTLSQGLFIV